jgi:hypothetical protein
MDISLTTGRARRKQNVLLERELWHLCWIDSGSARGRLPARLDAGAHTPVAIRDVAAEERQAASALDFARQGDLPYEAWSVPEVGQRSQARRRKRRRTHTRVACRRAALDRRRPARGKRAMHLFAQLRPARRPLSGRLSARQRGHNQSGRPIRGPTRARPAAGRH